MLPSRASRVVRKTIGSMREGESLFLFGNNKETSSKDEIPVKDLDIDDIVRQIQGCSTLDASLCALALRKCGLAKALDHGKSVHRRLEKHPRWSNILLSNLVIQMYGRCGDLTSAKRAFDSIKRRNKFSWNLMFSAYAQNGYCKDSLHLVEQLLNEDDVELDDVLLATVIGICTFFGNPEIGRRIHSKVTEQNNLIVHSALITMYGKCGCINEAKHVFNAMVQKDTNCWNSMITVYAQNGSTGLQALQLFNEMIKEGTRPDIYTYSAVFAACSSLGDLAQGRKIHMSMIRACIRPDIALENAMINMYGKCGSMSEARTVFQGMQEKDVISWTCMVGGYAANGSSGEALKLYKLMVSGEAGIKPNNVTHANALCACAGSGDLAQGREIHGFILRKLHGELVPSVIGCALINMYAKCSCLDEARSVFDELQLKDLACGSSMVAAYVQFGHLKESQQVIRQMVLDGTSLNAVTLVSLLIGCSYAGKVEAGRVYFHEMLREHNVSAVLDHYMCMIDLLGRAGRLQECEELIENMPFEPDPMAWVTLLSACKVHGDVERGKRASQRVSHLAPSQGSHNVLMATILERKHAFA